MNRSLINDQLRQLASVAFLLAAVATNIPAQTTEPSREPILRIETGMHLTVIEEMRVDTGNHYLVTTAGDRTIRIWGLPDIHLVRTIRPVIAAGSWGTRSSDIGIITHVTISPEGQEIAASVVADIVGGKWQLRTYVYDLDTGRVIHTLATNGVAYSRDGHYLAATKSDADLEVYDMRSYELVAEHKVINLTGVDFDSSGRLVTSSRDGTVQLWGAPGASGSLQPIAEAKLSKGGSNPNFPKGAFNAKFSPDGSKIAVAVSPTLDNAPLQVCILSGSDLRVLYSADLSGTGNSVSQVGPPPQIAWSYDGLTLYAGNLNRDVGLPTEDDFLIRGWANFGQGSYLDIPFKGNRLTSLLALPTGELLYTNDMVIHRSKSQGTQPVMSSAIIGFGSFDDLLVSPDGTTVQFNYKKGGEYSAQFSVEDRALDTGLTRKNLEPPNRNASSFRFDLRYDPEAKKFVAQKTRAARLSPKQIIAAISPDNQRLVTNLLRITSFDRAGTELWTLSVPAAQININKNGKFVVAAVYDGTIRWYRMTDGKELLAFFPHADRKRWVLWTPSGYYDASPGAEELIGWHVNNGKDQAADFFPVGQFRSTYYRPDVISKILETGDEARALQLANEERGRKASTSTISQMLPPVVEVSSPSDNSEVSSSEVTIRYSIRTPSGEAVTSVRALVDGRPVTGNRQLTREDVAASGVRELKVSVPERDSEVSIIAENRFAASVPATIRLKWRGQTAAATEAFVIQPKLYVLAIGVSQYQNPAYSLKYAAKDAEDFAAATSTQKGSLYRDVVTKVLTNEHATKDEILDGLDWIRKETTSKDVAMVFFAGHGLNDQNGVYYFLPYNTDLERLLRTGVPFTDIKNTVQSLAGKTLFFIDTCHSGNVLGGRRGLADDLNGIINELSSAESGAVVFAASTGNQYSLEDAKWNNGAFTKALVEGLTGRADYTGKGRITINMLDLYLSERVKELTGGRQTPTTAKPNTIQDFPIAVRR